MGSLDGKVAIVTGAGRGIGRCEALLLASEGAKVVVNDLGGDWAGEGKDDRPAQQVVDEIKAAGGEAAAKAGIAAMTVVFARELQRYGVTANAIAPRARTRMTEGTFSVPTAGEGEFDVWAPDNVAPIVAWLATDAAGDVSGQVFVVFG